MPSGERLFLVQNEARFPNEGMRVSELKILSKLCAGKIEVKNCVSDLWMGDRH